MGNSRFKFRAWEKKNNYYIYDIEHTYNDKHGNCFSDVTMGIYGYFIIEQCTGLKDKNGTHIYEGDIVKFENKTSEVKWCINGFAIDDGVQYLVNDMDIEVIGNIHENPELMEE